MDWVMGIILWPSVNVSQDSSLGQDLLRAGTLEQLERCLGGLIDVEDWIIHERDSAAYNLLRPETLVAELMCTCCCFFIGCSIVLCLYFSVSVWCVVARM